MIDIFDLIVGNDKQISKWGGFFSKKGRKNI